MDADETALWVKLCHISFSFEVGKMTEQSRLLAVLLEGSDSNPSTHMCLRSGVTLVPGIQCPPVVSVSTRHVHGAIVHTG